MPEPGRLQTDWSKEFGIKKIYTITGHTPHPLFTLFKILWIKDHQPDIWRDASYFLCFEDLFHYKVGVEPRISWSMAGQHNDVRCDKPPVEHGNT